MREILFRGKRTNGEWVEGWFINSGHVPRIKGYLGDKAYLVNSDTVGQFVGLLDHNGQRIFEGDIVADYDPEEGRAETVGVPVVYHDAGFCLKYSSDTSPVYHVLERGDCEYLAVIGNIHDNPELLDTPPTSP